MSQTVTILHVEDDLVDAQLIRETLAQDGFVADVERVDTEAAYVAALDRGHFDLILADYSLPSFDGLSALRIARARDTEVPVILVSGTLGEELAIESLKTGATDYVLKQRLQRLPLSVRRALRESAERSERRKAIKAVRDSEARYRLLFESNPLPMWVYDVETLAFLAVNVAAVEHYGYSQEEFLGMTIKDIRPPEDVAALLGSLCNAPRGIDRAGRWRHQKSDGSIIAVEITGHSIEFSGRSAELVLAHDITERELAQETASKLAAIVHSSEDAIIGKTLDGIITSWNQGAEKLYDYSAEEVVGRSIAILAPPEHSDELAAILEKLRRGESIDHFETERLTKEGKRISVSLTISPIRTESGRVNGASIIARDITERKAAEEARQISEIRYRRLFESAKDGILILDAESGNIVDVNPFLIEMLAYSKEELMGKKLWDAGVFSDLVASKSAFTKLKEQGYIRYENLPLETRDGLTRQVEFVSNSYLAGENRVMQCNVRDITERKLAEEELWRTNQRLEGALAELQTKTQELTSMTQQLWQASKLATMGELAASVAHELNNPLATISLHAEALVGQLAVDDPNRQSLLVIEQQVERMASLVSNLLLFSRRSHQQISTINITQELLNSLEFINYHLRSHNINVETEFADDLPSVQADTQQLRQVFLNLLTNASDAMPEGGTLTIRAREGILENGSPAVVIEFSDTGGGVQPQDLPKLWEAFFTTKPEGKGTGLGLPICRRTVEEHGGTIDLESLLGKGTTVRIILPATEVEI